MASRQNSVTPLAGACQAAVADFIIGVAYPRVSAIGMQFNLTRNATSRIGRARESKDLRLRWHYVLSGSPGGGSFIHCTSVHAIRARFTAKTPVPEKTRLADDSRCRQRAGVVADKAERVVVWRRGREIRLSEQ